MALHLVSEKVLRDSDIAPQQNRFLIPIADVRERLLPLLDPDERRDANLVHLTTKKRKKYDKNSAGTDGGDRRIRKQTEVGRKHGGLAVRLIAGDREIDVTLTQWDGTLGAVLKGGAEWKTVVEEQKLRKDERVELLAFRRRVAAVEEPGQAAKLCLLLRKKEFSRDNSTAPAEPALEARKVTNIGRSEPLDLDISLSLPAYYALQNATNSASTSSIAVVKWEENVFEENGLSLELTLRQPGSSTA